MNDTSADQARFEQHRPVPVVSKRPPLTSKQKRGAMLAGGLGFTVMGIGFSLVALVVFAFSVVLVVGSIVAFIERSGQSTDGFSAWLSVVVSDYWWVPAIAGVVGIGIWLVGYFASVRILRSSGNEQAVGITWSALGISIVASWSVGGLLSTGSSFSSAFSSNSDQLLPLAILAAIVGALLSLAATVAAGVFAWWWMAHALRADTAAGSQRDETLA